MNYDFPEAVFIIDILIGIGELAFRFYYLRQYVEVPYNLYFKRVLLPCFCVSLLILPVVIFCKMQTYDVMQNLVGIFLIEVYSICIVCWLGIDNSERKIIKNLKSKIVN